MIKTLSAGFLIFLLVLTGTSFGASSGTDNAAQAAYQANDNNNLNDGDPTNNTNGWANGDDGFVFGPAAFGPWTLSTTTANGGAAGFFIGDSTNLNAPGANINSSGVSFGMFGSNNSNGSETGIADAFRSFDSPLEVGQTFSLDMAVNFRNGQKGIDIRDSSNVVLFNFNIGNLGSGDDYTVQFAASGNGSIGNTYSSNTAFHIALTQTSASGGTWTITRSGGVTDLDTGTYTGVPDNFKLYVENTGGGSSNDFIVNNFSVPEPSTWVAAGLSVTTCVFMGLRRRLAVVKK